MKKIAVLGFGVVGKGVCKVIEENAHIIGQRANEEVCLGYICDLRDFPDSPYGSLHTKDFNDILNDPDVAVVAELTGARGAAYEMSKKALMAKKSVVTSNKEVVAAYGAELLQIARENGVSYLFEASVGGAIPILRPLRDCMQGDRIGAVYGILNGTTNYILTEMGKTGASYQDALAEAKALGYAEPNPAADVEGKDACRKICILGACISGKLVSPEEVDTKGITEVTVKDIRLAERLGGKIKLIGRAEVCDKGLTLSVSPTFVPFGNPLSFVDGVFNAILVSCAAAGELMFYGRGAGSVPTAAAVAGDIAEALTSPTHLEWQPAHPVAASAPASLFLVYSGCDEALGFATASYGGVSGALVPAEEAEGAIERIKALGGRIIAEYKAMLG